VPHFSKRDLGVPGLGDESDGPVSVAAALERVVTVINGPKPKGFRVVRVPNELFSRFFDANCNLFHRHQCIALTEISMH
jgi:hypothetical protein